MERLTDRTADGIAYVKSETGVEGIGAATTLRRLPELISRLAAYEDTGLEPDEIYGLCEMDKRSRMAKMLRWEEAERDGRLVVQKTTPGKRIWTLRRDEHGEAYDIGGYMFLTSVGQSIIVTPYINGMGNLEEIMGYHIKSTVEDYHTDLLAVFPAKDCFITREEAEAALAEKGAENA